MNWEQTGWAVFAITGCLVFWAEIRLSRVVAKQLDEVKQILLRAEKLVEKS